MPRRVEPEEHGESAPLWIVSFADLVTLMLSFFVILSAGNTKSAAEDPKFAEIVAALKAAFDNTPAAASAGLPADKAEFNKLVERLMALRKPKSGTGKRGDSEDEGLHGKSFRVRRLRDGLEMTIGGPVFFEAFNARPTPEGERQLREIMRLVKGHRNIVEIRGHAGEDHWPADWDAQSIMKLSYDRADFVAGVLRSEGVDPRAVRVVAAGANEPLRRGAEAPAESRRVEIFVREATLDDYIPEERSAGPSWALSGASSQPAAKPPPSGTH